MAPNAPTNGASSCGNLHACIDESRNLGQHLASRLLQIGCDTVFAVPGDYNLLLLDQLIKAAPALKMRYTCNELNAGYAADGYARTKGVGCVVVTYTVGGLSLLNAVAGAASERLPLIVITGGPNSNDWGTNRVLHHTIGLPDFDQVSEEGRKGIGGGGGRERTGVRADRPPTPLTSSLSLIAHRNPKRLPPLSPKWCASTRWTPARCARMTPSTARRCGPPPRCARPSGS